MARTVFHVVPNGVLWEVKNNGKVLGTHLQKSGAIQSARAWAYKYLPSQVVVHLANGRIETEWTYGNDPYPPAG